MHIQFKIYTFAEKSIIIYMATKIIPMSEKYRNKLVDYMHQKYPSFSDAYIQFDVNEAIGAKEKGTKSLIVINDNDEIVD